MMLNRDIIKTIGLTAILLTFTCSIQAKEYEGKSANKKKPSASSLSKMVDCSPPIAYTEFALNNVRFGLEAGGQIWEDNGIAAYEVPKVDPASGETSIHSLYAGALWIGGYSPDGQLKLAAVTYRTGGATDFYNGPLSTDNLATSDFCNSGNYNFFDQHFLANRTEVQLHRAYHEAVANPDVDENELFPDGYTTPQNIADWPGNFPEQNPNYSEFLAPFKDVNGDGVYDPEVGDYPWYDLDNAIDCRTRGVEDPLPLFGDQTLWWVFNDNGGIHTETGGQQIGMEIQAQVFAYTTTDQINNMSFFNYVLINRGVQTLDDCYFGQWVDPDVGCPTDDYVGCDVERGLSYTYNGDENDASCNGTPGYNLQPPAVGVDFFEGPFQDPDGLNNPLTTDLQLVNDQDGIPYGGLGIGYEDLSLDIDDPKRDNVVDNERYGMRRFVYYNRDDQTTTPAINGEPDIAIEFYGYLDGKWMNNDPMVFGGNGVSAGGGDETDYMFPGLTDPVGFATNGAVVGTEWTEGTEGNEPGDRRFIQSAGKFRLEPGEFNNITVGVVWARPFGDTDVTLDALRIADDKAQSLFDNCFRILSGPDAPDLSAQELKNEVLLYIQNECTSSNNYRESYGYPSDFAFDPLIPDLRADGSEIEDEQHYYEFQGYKIYQLKDATVSSAELEDPSRAQLVFQTDKNDGIGQLTNFVDDPTIGNKVEVEAVNGADEGIAHSFRVTEDAFATGARTLVNFKKYYFMAVAYAYNEYEEYNPATGNGQALTYIESRKSCTGAIPVITVIPHDPLFENSGTVMNSNYGDIIPVTRIEGEGNGGIVVDITEKTTNEILASEFNIGDELEYVEGASPIAIKVIDPLEVKEADFYIGMHPREGFELDDVADEWELTDPKDIGWYVVDQGNPSDTIWSNNAIEVGGEQLLPNYGISIGVEQYEYDVIPNSTNSTLEFLEATLTFDDPDSDWLGGIPDSDQATEQNWIRSGVETDVADGCDPTDPSDICYYNDYANIDPDETFESVLGGTISPWHVAANSWSGPAFSEENFQVPSSTRLTDLNSVNVQFTSNKDNWTRVPVLEMQHFSTFAIGGAEKLHTRIALSVDKNGKNQMNGGDFAECTMNGTQLLDTSYWEDMGTAQLIAHKLAVWPSDNPSDHADEELLEFSFGMGWFPGYAIDVESGERLNMAFGEDSALPLENGADMLWNPNSKVWNSFNGQEMDPNNARFGGKHYFYVFRNFRRQDTRDERMTHYDNANYLYYNINLGNTERKRIFRSCTWVGLPILNEGHELKSVEEGLIPSDALIRIRVSKPYARYATIESIYENYLYRDDSEIWTSQFPYFFWDEESGVVDSTEFDTSEFPVNPPTVPAYSIANNDWMPYYSFSTRGYGSSTSVVSELEAALELTTTNVVPNPYYGSADGYEISRLDNRVKIINLPADRRVTIRIYNAAGVLVRTLDKDSPDTFIDWDLKNERNVPIAGGVHIFHIEVPGVAEKIVKWFGVMRPVDLDNF